MKAFLYLECPPAERPQVDKLLRAAGLAVRWVSAAASGGADRDDRAVLPHATGTLREARLMFERHFIQEALDRHHGCVAETARTLGMQRTNLYRKMRSLGLVR